MQKYETVRVPANELQPGDRFAGAKVREVTPNTGYVIHYTDGRTEHRKATDTWLINVQRPVPSVQVTLTRKEAETFSRTFLGDVWNQPTNAVLRAVREALSNDNV